jgi:hypothetical protein
LGYLRPTETILFDDEKIRQMLVEANFQIVRFTYLGGLFVSCALLMIESAAPGVG